MTAVRASWPEEAVEMVESCGYPEGIIYLGQCRWPMDGYSDGPFQVPKKTKKQPQYYVRVQARDRARKIVLFFALPCESWIRAGDYLALGPVSTEQDLGLEPVGFPK